MFGREGAIVECWLMLPRLGRQGRGQERGRVIDNPYRAFGYGTIDVAHGHDTRNCLLCKNSLIHIETHNTVTSENVPIFTCMYYVYTLNIALHVYKLTLCRVIKHLQF